MNDPNYYKVDRSQRKILSPQEYAHIIHEANERVAKEQAKRVEYAVQLRHAISVDQPLLSANQRDFRELHDLVEMAAGRHAGMHFRWLADHYRFRQQPKHAAEMLRLAGHWADVAERLRPTSDPWATSEFTLQG